MDTCFRHSVLFYQNESFLQETVASLFASALARNEAVLSVATKENTQAILSALSKKQVPIGEHLESGRLTTIEASALLSKLLAHEWPEQPLFDAAVTPLIAEKRKHFKNVHVYGEMVNLLWQSGLSSAALRLEEIWNTLGKSQAISLSCGYQLNLFENEKNLDVVQRVCLEHADENAFEDSSRVEQAFHRAFADTMGADQSAMVYFTARQENPKGWLWSLDGIFWLREHMPITAAKVMDRARTIYQQICGSPVELTSAN